MKRETFFRTFLALVFGFVLTAFLAQGKTLASIVRAGLYFSVVFTGYKYGAGIGAVTGTCCGIIDTVWQNDISMMGMLCVSGVLSGVFRSLGKTGSAMGFLAGAATLGMIYLPQGTGRQIPEFFTAAVVFLLVPRKLCRQTEIRKDPIRPFTFYMPGRERTAAKRVQAVSDSMEKLAGTFSRWSGEEEEDECVVEEGIPRVQEEAQEREPLEELVWKERYEECREAVAEGFREMERILSRLSGDIESTADVSGQYRDRLRRELRARRVRLEGLMVLEQEKELKEVYLTVRALGNRCMTVRELAETVSLILEEKFLPSLDSRRIVAKEACTVRLVKAPAYMMLHGIARESRDGEQFSGDNFTFCRLPDGRMLFGLADGMGSGKEAFQDSETVMELAEQLMASGFGLEQSLRLMNSVLLLKEQEQRPITVDLAVADLHTGICEFVKAGGVTTFIKKGRRIETIRADCLPAGVLSRARPDRMEIPLSDGDKVIMVTDGILDALNGEDKEETMREILACTSGENLQDTADEILHYAKVSGEGCRDDMTVLAVGLWKA